MGQVAKVSPEDYDWLMQWPWRAQWSKNTQSYYAMGCGDIRGTLMHRKILGLERGDKRQGDHWNHDTLDNQRPNLRVATHSENQYNSAAQKNNTTGFKGVNLYRNGQYRATISVAGKQKHLGYRNTAKEASVLYENAARELHGEFLNLGKEKSNATQAG